MSEYSRGFKSMVIAAFWLSVMAVLVKSAGSRLPSQQMVLMRSVVILVLCGWLIHRFGQKPFWGNNIRLLSLRSILGYLGLIAHFYTLTRLPVADAVTLLNTNPLFTALIAHVFLGEKNRAIDWQYFILAFAGILLIIRPGFNVETVPAIIGLVGAVFSGAAYTTVRHLRLTDQPLNIVAFFAGTATLLTTPWVAITFVPPNGQEWLMLLGVGVTGFLGQYYITRALAQGRAARMTNIGYVNILFSAVWAYFLLGEIPDWRSAAGALIVIVAVLKIARVPGEE